MNFEERAAEFSKDIERGTGFVTISRDIGHNVSELQVGVGNHEGLVFKNGDVQHAYVASQYYDKLISYFQGRGFEPWSYELVKAPFVAADEAKGVIQPYFAEPSMFEALWYFRMTKHVQQLEKHRRIKPEKMEFLIERYLQTKEAESRCSGLFEQQQNKGVKPEDMFYVSREITDDYLKNSLYWKATNIIVLGKGSSGKIQLSIIDY